MSSLDATPKQYWRSLDDLHDSPAMRELRARRFPDTEGDLGYAVSRREFLRLMGASAALAGFAGCRRPVEHIVPYVNQPEQVVPGNPRQYATTMTVGLDACGVVVESHEGRPTKVEGNELHPDSMGKASAIHQAAVLSLFDQDRPQHPLRSGQQATWQEFLDFWRARYSDESGRQGAGLAVVSESFASPTLSRLRAEFISTFPKARWVTYEPISDENIFTGIKAATEAELRLVHRYDQADVIVSLDADFLMTDTNMVANTHRFAQGRVVSGRSDDMNRLYVAESGFSVTGAMADHRLRLQTSQIPRVAALLAIELQRLGAELGQLAISGNVATEGIDNKWIVAAAKDLLQAKSKSIVVAGRRQPPAVHALVVAINEALGNNGTMIEYRDAVDVAFPDRNALAELAREIDAGGVKTVIVLGGDPVYNAPADLNFSQALGRVETTIHLGAYCNETSKASTWHIPQSHFLEEWGDARASDGSLSLIQPLIAPLFASKSAIELLQLIVTGSEISGYDAVRRSWSKLLPELTFETQWRRVLHDGILANSASPAVQPRVQWSAVNNLLASAPLASSSAGLELVFQPSPAIYDGRFVNNSWLQELPDPTTKLVWDNAAIMNLATAAKVGINTSTFGRLDTREYEMVSIRHEGHAVEAPVFIVPGYADDSIGIYLGYGQKSVGRVGNGTGVNAYTLRTSAQPDVALGVTVTRTANSYPLSNTQNYHSMEGRPLLREVSFAEYKTGAELQPPLVDGPALVPLWKEHEYKQSPQWGMTIDLNLCTGCNACIIACQSENNIPVVGKKEAGYGREMHWIRLDRYYAGDASNPQMNFQPVPCMHCENAPCEQVCPVAATSHDRQGLNVMTYNRCIGTRYCSNNCPYKVRRFNFYNFTYKTPEIQKMANNPDVTVRSRGVMEKCTYCLQRISEAGIGAKLKGVPLRDGDVRTACQQTCPAGAIVFGDILDGGSQVAQKKQNDRNYVILGEWHTKPRTSYLGKLRNPNPELI